MNIKKLFLLALLGLSTAIVRPNDDQMGEIVAATGTLGSDDVQFVTVVEVDTHVKHHKSLQAQYNMCTMIDAISVNAIPGALVGAFTGTSISYLAGTLFDALINTQVIASLIGNDFANAGWNGALRVFDKTAFKDGAFCVIQQATTFQKCLPAIIALARLGVQVGSKYYWEKPLRNKIMNWLQADLKAKGVEFNEELMKTIARVSAWVGCVSQLRP